jgi:D-alanyl-D-alanine carboxypeptidase
MHRKLNALLVIALLLLQTAVVRADKVDDYVKAEMQKQRILGLSVAVVKEGKVIKAEGYGLANVEHNIAAKPETVYKIGSVSKQFLSTGIMLLVQDGKLRVDDKVSQYLDGTPETWKDITIRHFLTHTSGVVREGPGFDPFKVQSDFDVIKTAYPLALRFPTGEKYEYCNVGYFSLAEIIRRVSGKTWEEFLSERVFAPLGMTATRTTTTKEIVPNRAAGYAWAKDKLQNATEYLALRPSGAFLSTVLDLAKWDAALYTDKFLKQATREQMWTPARLNSGATHPYGFGWELAPLGNHKQVNHGGSLPGFRAQYARFVDDKLSLIVLTNCDNAQPQTIARGIAALYFPDLATTKAAGTR